VAVIAPAAAAAMVTLLSSVSHCRVRDASGGRLGDKALPGPGLAHPLTYSSSH